MTDDAVQGRNHIATDNGECVPETNDNEEPREKEASRDANKIGRVTFNDEPQSHMHNNKHRRSKEKGLSQCEDEFELGTRPSEVGLL